MKGKHLFTLAMLLFIGMVTLMPAQAQSLISSCQYCFVGDTVTYIGSGFHGTAGTVPFMKIWGDNTDPTTCALTTKTGFICTVTYTVGPGVYNIDVYDQADITAKGAKYLGGTNCILQAPGAAAPKKPAPSKMARAKPEKVIR